MYTLWPLFAAYHAIHYAVFAIGFGLDNDLTIQAVSYMHGIVSTASTAAVVLMDGAHYNQPNTLADTAVMIHSFVYFVFDTFQMIMWRFNTVYILHHVVTMIAIGTFLYGGIGGRAVVLGLLMGEITNPLQRMHKVYLIRHQYSEASRNSLVRRRLQRAFSLSFLFMRVIVIPCVFWHMLQTLSLPEPLYTLFALSGSMIVVAGLVFVPQIMSPLWLD